MYRYTAGKLDWLAANLPVEGAKASAPRIAPWAHADVPTCGLEDPIDLVHRRAALREKVRQQAGGGGSNEQDVRAPAPQWNQIIVA